MYLLRYVQNLAVSFKRKRIWWIEKSFRYQNLQCLILIKFAFSLLSSITFLSKIVRNHRNWIDWDFVRCKADRAKNVVLNLELSANTSPCRLTLTLVCQFIPKITLRCTWTATSTILLLTFINSLNKRTERWSATDLVKLWLLGNILVV